LPFCFVIYFFYYFAVQHWIDILELRRLGSPNKASVAVAAADSHHNIQPPAFDHMKEMESVPRSYMVSPFALSSAYMDTDSRRLIPAPQVKACRYLLSMERFEWLLAWLTLLLPEDLTKEADSFLLLIYRFETAD
jgi:hypothetical protein